MENTEKTAALLREIEDCQAELVKRGLRPKTVFINHFSLLEISEYHKLKYGVNSDLFGLRIDDRAEHLENYDFMIEGSTGWVNPEYFDHSVMGRFAKKISLTRDPDAPL